MALRHATPRLRLRESFSESRQLSAFTAPRGARKRRRGEHRPAPVLGGPYPEGPLVPPEDGFWGVKRRLSTCLEGTWTLLSLDHLSLGLVWCARFLLGGLNML